jgi:cation:H+ antiporter
MIWTFTLLAGSAGLIYFSCESFINSVEWLGQKLRLTQTATGTVLAAFGTALPESAVTLIAAAFGHTAAEKEIGIGAAIGGPLALSTVAYAVVGLALLTNTRRLGRERSHIIKADTQKLRRDQIGFLAIFAIKIGLGLMVLSLKPWLGLAFLITYAVYCWKELSRDEGSDKYQGQSEPLRLRPHDSDPALVWIATQTLVALIIIFAASHLFVK